MTILIQHRRVNCWELVVGRGCQEYCLTGPVMDPICPPGGFLAAVPSESCYHDRCSLQPAWEWGRGENGHFVEVQDCHNDTAAELDAGDIVQTGNAGTSSGEPAY